MSELIWRTRDDVEHRVEVEVDMVIGRDPTCALVLDDPTVSRRHAIVVQAADGSLQLSDNNSTYGIFMGGRRVPSCPLRNGVCVRLGDSELIYRTDRSSSIAPAAGESVSFPPEHSVTDVAEIRRRYELLRATYELTRALGVESDVSGIVERILDTAFEMLSAERGSIVLFDSANGSRALEVGRTRRRDKNDFRISETILEEVVRTKRGLISADAASDERFNRSESICVAGVQSAMYVPLVHEQRVLGVIHVDSRLASNVFDDTDLELFTSIANTAAIALAASVLRDEVIRVREEERKRLELILDALPIGVLLLSPDGNPERSNPSGLQMLESLGVDPQRAIARIQDWSIEDIVVATGYGPVEMTTTQDTPRILHVVAVAGTEAQTILAMTDVTVMRARAEHGAQAERLALIGQLSGGVAHDFNNLLAVIRSNVELLFEDFGRPNHTADVLEEIGVIGQAADRGVALTKQMLTFARQRSGAPAATDIAQVVFGLEPILRRAASTHELRVNVEEPLPPVWLDSTQLEQILMNLVVNARDASEPGRSIELDVRTGDDGVSIRVTDHGSGIPDDVAAHIFEPFFTTKEVGRGTGLGLSTVHGIVQSYRGRIDLESSEGVGTCFTIWFPAHDANGKNGVPALRAS